MAKPTQTELPGVPRANVATLLRYLHDERMANAGKRNGDAPSFSAKRATTSGALGVWELNVSVPVCDEYPTSEAAFAAQLDYMRRLEKEFPLPSVGPQNGGKR